MGVRNTVTLGKSSGYWKVFYYDSIGKRHSKSLGSLSKLSKRQARVLCNRFAATLMANPGRADVGRAPRLSDFLERYLQQRTDLRASTKCLHEQTVKCLKGFFAVELRIDGITRKSAMDWRSALAASRLTRGRSLKEAPVCKHVRNAKTIFNTAVDQDLLDYNPFDRLKGTAPEPDKDWHYCPSDEFDKILKVCAHDGWRAFLGLCRLAGLRSGEALSLRWQSVDWENHRLTIVAKKTGRQRVVPVVPKLMSILLRAYQSVETGSDHVCDRMAANNHRREFHRICRHAGIEPWSKWCHTLRKNCETDWAQQVPQYVVAVWMGHGIEVSARHYLQVPEQLYATAARTELHQTAPKSAPKRDSADPPES